MDQLDVRVTAEGTTAQAPRQVIVAVDRSPFADRALRPAVAVACRIGATVSELSVVGDGDDVAGAEVPARRWDGTAVDPVTVVGDNAGVAIVEYVAGRPDCLVCLASHGRRWPASSLIGSTAATVVAGSAQPVLVVGPSVEPAWDLGGRVVVCVDGDAVPPELLDVAVRWAGLLDARLDVVMVVEPVPASSGARRSDDPEAYMAGVVSSLQARVADVDGHVIFDTIGPAPGVRSWLHADPVGLVLVAGHARPGRAEIPLGHRAMQIIHSSPLPTLVVPVVSVR